jgi:hypothetical protein
MACLNCIDCEGYWNSAGRHMDPDARVFTTVNSCFGVGEPGFAVGASAVSAGHFEMRLRQPVFE